jgi:hypothetical protein
MKRREVVELRTQENLTIRSAMIQISDHGGPLVGRVFKVIGQIGQLSTVSCHP